MSRRRPPEGWGWWWPDEQARRNPPPTPSGIHRIALQDGSAAEIGTVWRSGVWACGSRLGWRGWTVSHLPTGISCLAASNPRPAELCLEALGEHRLSWGEGLGWADREGWRAALADDPEPDLIAAYWTYRDRLWGSLAIPIVGSSDRPWADWIAVREQMRLDRARRLASPDPDVRALALADELIDGYLHEDRR